MRQARYPIFERLGKALHDQLDDIAREPLPERWTDLIKYLGDKERRDAEGAGPCSSQPPKLKPVNT
jgi:hypothetical protein